MNDEKENTVDEKVAAQPEALDLRSLDVAGKKRAEMIRLFPEARTEGGKIDFDRLKLALGETVDVGRERYGLTWPGKADCFKAIQTPSIGTLRPCPAESVNFDTTENLIIEGDNLEVLKLLQKSYLGKVKMIFIDPPYNTGNDFIYPDNYSESLQTYLEYTGQVDAHGKKFSTNAETDGRFHSKWLSMMYPRLYLARHLLRDDGVLFATIDDDEVVNFRSLLNLVFGEENFIASICWQKKQSPQRDAMYFSDVHDYVLVYARTARTLKSDPNGFQVNLVARSADRTSQYQNPDNDPRGPWASVDCTINKTADERPNLFYPITNPLTGEEILPSRQRTWAFERERLVALIADKRIWWGAKGTNFPRLKTFLSEAQEGVVPTTLWLRSDVGDNQEAARELKELFPETYGLFETPKPSRLIKAMLERATFPGADGEDIVLDFFAGAGSTAQAVANLNQEDGGHRRFVLVQLPEPTGREDYSTIADICKERVRRVMKTQREEEGGQLGLDASAKPDLGFRVFKLAESNFKTWDGSGDQDPKAMAKQLELHAEHVRDGRTPQDILYELLLKSGFPITAPVKTLTISEKTVFAVSGGEMLVCLEKDLSLELIREIAGRPVGRVICLDEGFAGNDQLKTNAVQIFKAKGIVFKTV